MSDYESHSGKLRLIIPNEGESLDDLCRRLWVDNGKSIDEYDYDKFLEIEFSKRIYELKYHVVNEKLYEMIEHNRVSDDDDSFCRLNKNSDGTYSFHSRFYNGGTCLSEMLEDSLNDIDF